MHPEIKEFWEATGKPIHSYNFSQYQVWFLVSDPNYYGQGGPPPPLRDDIVCRRWISEDGVWNKAYYLQNQSYTEKEMLKIIELKAFI